MLVVAMKIRSDILRVYQSLHTWVGICAGMLLFIGFFAGALTMFKEPLDRWISAPGHALPAMPVAQTDALVRALLTEHPAARQEFTLHLQRHENIAAPASWSEADSGHELDLSGRRWHAALDADGALMAQQQRPSLLAELIDMLHRTGGVPGMLGDEYAGIYLMGIAGVLYFLALVSGLILLLPTLVKDFFVLRQGKNRKRFWLDAHNVVGIASLPYHIVISVTVIVFAFHDQFYGGLQRMVYGEQPMFTPRVAAQTYPLQALRPASELIATVRRAAPEFEVTELMFMRLESPRPLVRAAVASPRYVVQGARTGYVMIHPYTGKVVDTSMLPSEGDPWVDVVAPMFALHFGSYGGNLMRWVYFAFGLSGAFLFYSGNLLWLEKRRKQQLRNGPLPQQRLATRLMAAATVGVCLGAVAGVGFSIVAGKWLLATAENINMTYLAVYYAVFVAALVWAFWRGAARAGIELLCLCALAALAIPLTSLTAWLLPSSGWWAHGSAATLGVDLTALAFAVVLAWAARQAARRARLGPSDSVWAVSRRSSPDVGAP
jgi:uncharacterized iron-regulated membrane protein